MKNNSRKHDTLRIYWERSGKPKIQFKFGDKMYESGFKEGYSKALADMGSAAGHNAIKQGYELGYAKALADLTEMVKAKQCKSSM